MTYRVTDWPEPRSACEYQKAVDTFVGRLSREEAVDSVYQIGSIDVAGISDIDLLVFLDDEVPVVDPASFTIRSLPRHLQYLFMHDVFVIPRSMAGRIDWHYRVESLDHLYGSHCLEERDLVDEAVSRSVNTSVAVDFTLSLLRAMMIATVSRSFPMRPSLCLLRSVSHSIAAYEALGLPRLAGADEFDLAVIDLRDRAFEISNDELAQRAAGLIADAADLCFALLGAVASLRLAEPEYLGRDHDVSQTRLARLGPGTYGLFRSDFSARGAREWAEKHSLNVESRYSPSRLMNRVVFELPWHVYDHLAAYRGDGPISGRFRAALDPSTIGDDIPCTPYRRVLAKRAALADEQARFLAERGLTTGQLFLNNAMHGSAPRSKAGGIVDGLRSWRVGRL